MRILCLLMFSLFGLSGFALDSSSDVLLNNKTSSVTPDQGISSGRYSVRNSAAEAPSEVVAPPTMKKKKSRRISSDTPAAVAVAPEPVVEKSVQTEPTGPVSEKVIPTPSYADQVKDLVLGKALPELDAYREQVHPDDIRLNRVEIDVTPGLVYVDSKSTQSFRSYNSFSPMLRLGGEIWWTPFIGIYGGFGTSMGADVKNGNQTQSNSSVTHEVSDFGIDFRQFFGLSRKSNSNLFGLHYMESKFSPPSDSTSRTRTKTSGFGIHFKARFPIAPTFAWTLGAKIDPRVSHSEYGTNLGLQSGSSVESSRWGIHLGSEFKLSRQNQLVWDLSYTIEKNQFSGSSNLTDPETNSIPSGVSVTNSMTFMSLGYRWGY